MKNKVKKIGVVLIIIFLAVLNFVPRKSEEVLQKENLVESKKTLSMMLETGSNTGVYEQTTRESWPTEGYLFNAELSKCENGGKLSWDSETENVIMISDTSDKCYVYFDVYNLAVINSLTEEVTTSSIKLTVNAISGTKPITKYYYSKDNGVTYSESLSNTYTFTDLTKDTTYNIKVYALDENGKSSEVYSKLVKTDNTLMLADYVKSLFTTQGSNGLYLHNSSLANGANDGSYRYAGSNPNNYVCFGTDAESCPNDNLYRIIGVFGDKVKLIKADYANTSLLGTDGDYYNDNIYYWNYKLNNTLSNTWSTSLLNKKNLNTNFINNIGELWTDKIATTNWKVGGNTYAKVSQATAPNVYQNEIVSPAESTTYSAKIGLMYVSDYGYAAPFGAWTTTLNNYNNVSDNWLFIELKEWTISRYNNNNYQVVFISADGSLGMQYPMYIFAVRPCFYLNSSVQYLSGVGTSGDPIKIN